MSIPMLPKLKASKDVSPWIGTKWSRVSSLNEILDALETISSDRSKDLFAIPDVYEKAIKFTNIMKTQQFAPDIPLASEVIHWRCLLVMFALQKTRNLPVRFSKRDFSEYQNGFANALKLEPKEQLFTHVYQKPEWSWLPFYTIQYNSEDIALFSPSTLLYPVVNIEKKINGGNAMPWYNVASQSFYEPQNYLTEEEKRLVYVWLDRLYSLLTQIRDLRKSVVYNVNQELLAAIMKHVKEFQKELHVNNNDQLNDLRQQWGWIDQTSRCFNGCNYGINIASVINITMNPNIYVMENQISMNEIFSEKLLYCIGERNPFQNCSRSDKYEIRNYQDYDGRGNQIQNGKRSAFGLLPFSEVFFDALLECEESKIQKLAEHINMSFHRDMVDGEIKQYVLVEIDLSKIDVRNFKISKKYYFDDQSIDSCVCLDEEEPFLLCLWPDIMTTDWKRYYAYFKDESPKRNEKPFEIVIKKKNSEIKKGITNQQFDYLPSAIGIMKENIFYGAVLPERPQLIVPSFTSRAVVAVDFGTTGTRVFARINNEQSEEIHLDDENILTLIDRVPKVDGRDVKQLLMADEFLPERRIEKNQKLFSVYHYFTRDKAILDMLIDGNIYLPDDNVILWNKDSAGGKILLENTKLVTNIKWDGEATAKYFSAFLMQICMQTTVYLLKKYQVSEIEWRYSVPSSMSPGQIERMKNTWQRICSELEDATGLTHNLLKSNLNIFEGYVASYYFSQKSVGNYPQGFYSIDIGGGTTDIALWQSKEVAAGERTVDEKSACRQLSVKVAGRRILTIAIWDYLEEFYRLTRDKEMLNEQIRTLLKRKQMSGDTPEDDEYAAIDKLISVYGDDIRNLIRVNTGDAGNWLTKFQARLSMNVAMLMFCLGKIMAECIDCGDYVIQDRFAPFYICIGGNGSHILDWVGTADWNTLGEEGIKKAFINVFRASRARELERLRIKKEEKDGRKVTYSNNTWSAIEKRFQLGEIDVQIYKSLEPKQEIVQGLLRIDDETVRAMKITKKENLEPVAREVLSECTEEFLALFKAEFEPLGYYAELVNEKNNRESGKIDARDSAKIRGRVEQLFRHDNNPESDARTSKNIYEGLFNHVLLNYLNEDVR